MLKSPFNLSYFWYLWWCIWTKKCDIHSMSWSPSPPSDFVSGLIKHNQPIMNFDIWKIFDCHPAIGRQGGLKRVHTTIYWDLMCIAIDKGRPGLCDDNIIIIISIIIIINIWWGWSWVQLVRWVCGHLTPPAATLTISHCVFPCALPSMLPLCHSLPTKVSQGFQTIGTRAEE